MAWFFEGSGQQLGLSCSPKGFWRAYGTCSQRCLPKAGDAEIFKYVKGIQGAWSINSPASGWYDKYLKDFFDNNKGNAAARIAYYNGKQPQYPAFVEASILMPQPAFRI
jgi:hypothetical protein